MNDRPKILRVPGKVYCARQDCPNPLPETPAVIMNAFTLSREEFCSDECAERTFDEREELHARKHTRED